MVATSALVAQGQLLCLSVDNSHHLMLTCLVDFRQHSTDKLVLVLLAFKVAFLLTACNVSVSSVGAICFLLQCLVEMGLTARSSKMCAKQQQHCPLRQKYVYSLSHCKYVSSHSRPPPSNQLAAVGCMVGANTAEDIAVLHPGSSRARGQLH